MNPSTPNNGAQAPLYPGDVPQATPGMQIAPQQPAALPPLPSAVAPLPPQAQPAFQPPYATAGPAPQAYAPPQPAYGVPGPAPTVANQAATKPAASNPNSTQNSLLIAEIRDGIVIMNDGSFRSVVMVKSVNFDLMSQQEQEAVEYSYQNFLNSLYFPVQIFVRSQKVDLQPYIAKLDKIRSEHENMLLAMLMEDYIQFIDQLSLQTNIMDKRFYVVVPFFPHGEVTKAITQSKNFLTGFMGLLNTKEQHVVVNEADLEKAKTELRNRVQSVLGGLQQANIQGLPLDTEELIELYYEAYNPDTAARQPIKNFEQLGSEVIIKGQGMAVQPHLQRELN